MAFVKAQRQRASLKIAITGPSGSGKTYGALRLAFGLGRKVALIDTENHSASLYDTLGDYDVQDIAAPFTAAKYIAAINEAVAGGYDVLIIDSLSHVWAGDGGLLDQKSAKDGRGGNQFSNWADISKVYEQLKSALLQSPIHIIATMRSKQDYVIETGANNKQTPRKVGLAPIQREGLEYEFTTVLDVDMSHTAATSKDRTGLFTDEVSQITEEHGRRLAEWLAGAAEPDPVKPAFAPPRESPRPAAPNSGGTAYGDRAPRPVHPEDRQGGARQTPDRRHASLPAAGPGGTPACATCGKALTKAQQDLSVRNYGEPLCPVCQRRSAQATQSQASKDQDSPPARPAPHDAGEDDPFEGDDFDGAVRSSRDPFEEGLATR